MQPMITGHTRLTAVLGSPITHSISPAMHNEAFRVLGLDYAYLAFEVDKTNFEPVIEGLKAMNVKGFNCTMPLKRLMFDKADELSDTARIVHAVNTVLFEDGKLIGHNTDGYGFMQSIRDTGFDYVGKEMTLLGSGGAASAIMAQAALDGVTHLHVFSRPGSASTAVLMEESKRVETFTPCKVSFYDLADLTNLRQCLEQSAVLTNASSVGMAPHNEGCLIPDASYLHKDMLIADVIYNPRVTQLMAMGQEIGCPTMNGLYMLLHQGAKAFEIWTGQKMPVEHIRNLFFQ